MVTCQSSELDWEDTVELPADFLSLGRGSVMFGSDGLLLVGVVFFPSSSLVGVMLFPSYAR